MGSCAERVWHSAGDRGRARTELHVRVVRRFRARDASVTGGARATGTGSGTSPFAGSERVRVDDDGWAGELLGAAWLVGTLVNSAELWTETVGTVELTSVNSSSKPDKTTTPL